MKKKIMSLLAYTTKVAIIFNMLFLTFTVKANDEIPEQTIEDAIQEQIYEEDPDINNAISSDEMNTLEFETENKESIEGDSKQDSELEENEEALIEGKQEEIYEKIEEKEEEIEKEKTDTKDEENETIKFTVEGNGFVTTDLEYQILSPDELTIKKSDMELPITVYAIPAENSKFLYWKNDEEIVSTEAYIKIDSLDDKDNYFIAVFEEIEEVKVTFKVNGKGYITESDKEDTEGFEILEKKYKQDEEIKEIYAVPEDGYEFVSWTLNGKEISFENELNYKVQEEIEIIANFREEISDDRKADGLLNNAKGSLRGTKSAFVTSGNFITFKSQYKFALYWYRKGWDGTIQYSSDASTWITVQSAGTDMVSALNDDGFYYLFIRGSGNTTLNSGPATQLLSFDFSNISTRYGSDIYISGDIETLLDYQKVANGQHPSAAAATFTGLFSQNSSFVNAGDLVLSMPTVPSRGYLALFDRCSNLVVGPRTISATAATTKEYRYAAVDADVGLNMTTMFQNDTSLLVGPKELKITTVIPNLYTFMFYGASNLRVTPTISATGTIEELSTTDEGMIAAALEAMSSSGYVPYGDTGAMAGMFEGTTNLRTMPNLYVTGKWYDGLYQFAFKNSGVSLRSSSNSSSGHTKSYRFPASGTAENSPSCTGLVFPLEAIFKKVSTREMFAGTAYWSEIKSNKKSQDFVLVNKNIDCKISNGWNTPSYKTMYVKNGYNVVYVTNGGSSVTHLTYQTKLPSTLPTPTKAGAVFEGWYLDNALTQPATAGATINWDTALFAKWSTSWVGDKPTANITKTYNGSSQSNDVEVVRDRVTVTGSELGTNAGIYTATYTPISGSYWSDGTNTPVTVTLTIEKVNGNVNLSAASGTVTYPSTKTFTITENLSGGELSISNNNASIITASLSGTTVTLTPSAITTDGQTATITVISAATTNYKQASKTYTATVNRGTFTLTSTAASAAYSGNPQYAKVKSNLAGVRIVSGTSTTYDNLVINSATANTDYNLLPSVTNASTTTIYYKGTKAGYKDVEGTTTITIAKISNTMTYPSTQSWSATLSDNSQTKTIATASNANGAVTYTIQSQSEDNYFSLSGTTLTMVGGVPEGVYTLTIRASSAGDTNHNAKSIDSTMTVTVSQAKQENPITYANQSWNNDYSTSSQTKTLSQATNAQGTVSYSLQSQKNSSNNNVTYFTFNSTTRVLTQGASTPAGTYIIVIRATAVGNETYDEGFADSTVTVTVSRASVGDKPGASVSKTYTGSAQNNGYTTPTGVGMTGNNSGTDAGTYTATYTPDSNHKWSDGTTTAVSRTLTINGAEITVSAPNQSFDYDGSVHGNAISATTVNSQTATIRYRTESIGDYTITSAPQATNVSDSKTVYYKVTAPNHTDKTGSYILTINKVANPLSYANQTWLYTFATSAQTKTLNAATNGQGTVTYSLVSQKQGSTDVAYFTFNASTRVLTAEASTPVGTYTVIVRASTAGNENYNAKTADSTITVTISKAGNPLAITTPQSGSLTYSTSVQSRSFTAATNGQGTVTYSITAQKDSGNNTVSYFTIPANTTASLQANASTPAGIYTITLRASATGNDNYNSGTKDATYTLTINKAGNSVTYADQSWSYDYATSAQTKTLTSASATAGIISYSLQSQKNSSNATVTYFTFNTSTRVLTAAANTPVGTYSVVVRASASESDNYGSAYKDSIVTVTISKAFVGDKPTGTVSRTYIGSSQNNGYITPSGVNMSGSNSGTNVGTYTATYTPDSNHMWSDGTSSTVSRTLSITNASITVSAGNQSYIWTGNAQGSAISATTVGGQTATIKYGTVSGTYNLDTAPKITNVSESKTIFYKVTAPNHNDATGSYTLTITKASGSVTAPTAKTGLTYSGTSQTLINAGSSSTGTIQYKLGASGTYGTSLPSGTTAGTYDVYYKVIGDSNHEDVSEAGPIQITIDKAESTMTFTATQSLNTQSATVATTSAFAPAQNANGSVTYSITSQKKGSSNVNYFSLANNSSASLTIAANTPSGTYTIAVKAHDSGDANHNAKDATSTITLVVSTSYTITIPASVNLNETNSLSIGYNIVGGSVSISAESVNNWKFKQGSYTIPYSISSTFWTFSGSGSEPITITWSGSPRVSGTYSDQLIFTINAN